jgi:hypothetical protein
MAFGGRWLTGSKPRQAVLLAVHALVRPAATWDIWRHRHDPPPRRSPAPAIRRTPADELRTAAARLRTLATDATDGPWTPEQPEERWEAYRDVPIIGSGKPIATVNSEYGGLLNAAYIAAMHPGVGTAIADWLDSAAYDAGMIGPDHHALAVARLINQEQP